MFKNKIKLIIGIVTLVLSIFLITGCSNEVGKENAIDNEFKDNLAIHFIDVGQADCILLENKEEVMLIDGGNNADATLIKDYLEKQDIKKIQYLIGTHPHEDHIGGLDTIIDNFEIGEIYMPKVSSNTKTFKDVVLAAKNKGLTFTSPKVGHTFKLGNAKCTILAPGNEKYEDTNDYSIVIRVEHGDNSFLFTGDAGVKIEKEIIDSGMNLASTLLKIGHHGSTSSTSKEFLDSVNPKYGVITVGTDNDYGHPRQDVMNRLKDKKVEIYRTDENGTIIATSDGNSIKFNVEPGSYKGLTKGKNPNDKEKISKDNESSIVSEKENNKDKIDNNKDKTENNKIVYWTPNGKSYHFSKDCSTLSNSKTINEGTKEQSGKSDPCDRCAM